MGNLVDLFAGCGGMSLGLERAGFSSMYVNELSTDAMSTYIRNQRPQSAVHDERFRSHDIHELTGDPDRLHDLARELRHRAGGDVDLVAGGPPCQGFSRIGHRRTFKLEKEQIPSNHLYKEMAKAIEAIEPRAFIFENVQGLLSSRWTASGEKGEIWQDVRETFENVVARTRDADYLIKPHLIRSREFGVPQNRPRVILVGVRRDVAESANYENEWYKPGEGRAPDPEELLDDLCQRPWTPGGSLDRYSTDPLNETQRELRTQRDGTVLGKGALVTEQDYSNHSVEVQTRFSYIRQGISVPKHMLTKKFYQRPIPAQWPEDGPNLTVASLPDDFIHYSENRAPTVREWARFQGFPDWYQFSGPRTTGGRRRAGDPSKDLWTRDLPKFTQIGNAVPVALAEWLGRRLDSLLGLSQR